MIDLLSLWIAGVLEDADVMSLADSYSLGGKGVQGKS